MQPEFTGNESPSDILKLALDHYSETPRSYSRIVYEGEVPYLVYTMPDNKPPGFVGRYRLDKILLGFFPQCETLFDHFAKAGLAEESERKPLIRYIAFTAMSGMIDRLILLQLALLEDNFHDTAVLSFATFLHALAKTRQTPETQDDVKISIRNAVRVELNKRVKMTATQKRQFLIGFINTHPLLSIPPAPGRPEGSKKSEEKKQEDRLQLERQLEQAIRALFAANGRMPTRVQVAKELGIGGDSSRSSAFYNKLKRYGVDYDAIAAKVKLHG